MSTAYIYVFTALPAFVNILGASAIPFAGPFITSFSMFIAGVALIVPFGFYAPIPILVGGVNLIISSLLDIGGAIFQLSSLVED